MYEEKLISPLAIRFSQQRIRKNFQDGRELDAAIQQITSESSDGDYDVILTAPFPTIEILRYSPHGRTDGGHQAEGAHWFTFDNRRLYCLQRKATEQWPKRVGTLVRVLHCDDGTIRKKLDSASCGKSVSIGHAFATEDELQVWDWREDVVERAPPGLPEAERAEEHVDEDDAKMDICDLTEAPGGMSAFERLAKHFAESEALLTSVATALAPQPVVDSAAANDSDDNSHETPSTAATEDVDTSATEAVRTPQKKAPKKRKPAISAATKALCGVWTGEKYETYTVTEQGENWLCVREDTHSSKRFTLQYDKAEKCIWWGLQGTYWADLMELAEYPQELRWYGARDNPGHCPRFSWGKTEEPEPFDSDWKEESHMAWKGLTHLSPEKKSDSAECLSKKMEVWERPKKREKDQQRGNNQKWDKSKSWERDCEKKHNKPQQQWTPSLAQSRPKWMAVDGGA